MSFLYRIRAIFTITVKRLWAQRVLTTVTILGLVTAVALIMTVPLYSDAVYFRILQEELRADTERGGRPPFAYLYDYIGTWSGSVELEDVQAVDDYMRTRAARELGLPQVEYARHLETEKFKLFPSGTGNYEDEESSLGIFYFANTTGIEEHIELVDGAFPDSAETNPESTIAVLITEALANESGLQVGDQLIAYDYDKESTNPRETPAVIAGVWRAVDVEDDYWFFRQEVFDDLLLVSEATFTERLSPALNNEITRALWYLILDGSSINTSNADALATRSFQVERRVDTLMPGVRNVLSPADALGNYQSAAQQLTVLLTAFNVPVIGLILAFIALIVGLAVNQRRNEIAVIRSRGGTPYQVMGFALLEGVILGLIAVALGMVLALLITQLMGRSRSFLDFSASADLRVAFTPNAWQAALVAIGLAIVAQVIPTIAASRDTIITYKQEQARSLQKPLWQRMWLDVMLLIPALYGIYQLRQQGSIIAPGAEASSDTVFQNPLLFLIPILFVFSLTLLFIRVLPWLMKIVTWLLERTNSIGVLMAARQLARAPRIYTMPLVLLVLTASLAVFTASLAQTLDFQLYDATRYAIGADVNLRGAGVEYGSRTLLPGADDRTQAVFLPLDEYEQFPGVVAATRIGRYDADSQIGGSNVDGVFIGVDRADFGDVAYWRWDFAPYRLGSMMNALAVSADSILVSEQYAREYGLRPGDFLRLTVNVPDGQVELNSQIAGTFDYFPTWYEAEDGPLFVGNLETLFAQTGGDLPYEVWMATDGEPDVAGIDNALTERQLFNWTWKESFSAIEAEQRLPERQGVFGLLSVGFIAAALLTVLGFFMYALFSLRQRFITLGILRAVGLSQRQMTIWVAFELAFLIVTGLTLGTLFGILISQIFIPYLQFGASAADVVPPFLVEIAWPAVFQIYILFGLMFVVALAALALILRRMRIFQAIKLGETV